MFWLIIVVKVIASFFFLGFFIGGLVRASPHHRNPDIDPKIEWIVGAIGIIVSVGGWLYLWVY